MNFENLKKTDKTAYDLIKIREPIFNTINPLK